MAFSFLAGRFSPSRRRDCPNGYLFVTMGAGDNWKVGEMLPEKF